MHASSMKRFGDWLVFEHLGKGGQGQVFLVRLIPQSALADLDGWLAASSGIRRPGLATPAEALLQALHGFGNYRIGALKHLHPAEQAKNAKTCLERFRREVEVLQRLKHPSLIRLLDANLEKQWLVMDYHRQGTLTANIEMFRGDPVTSALALRPLVEGVAAIHAEGLIHRDIKPDNVFVANDGRLVLGDWGLVIDVHLEQPRLTETYENAGSWQWMPTWAQGKRVEELDPSFDTFCLAKVMWAMVSGRSFLRFHHYDDPDFDLERQFPEDARMSLVNEFLSRCLVDRKGAGIPDCAGMLTELDGLIAVLRSTAPKAIRAAQETGETKPKWSPVHAAGHMLAGEAVQILVEAAQDSTGSVLFVRSSSGTALQTNGKNLIPDALNPRSVARYTAALDRLEAAGCLKMAGNNIWSITDLGYRAADAAKPLQS